MKVRRLWPMWSALAVVGVWYAVAARAEVKPSVADSLQPPAIFESARVDERFELAPPERVFSEPVVQCAHVEPVCPACEKACSKKDGCEKATVAACPENGECDVFKTFTFTCKSDAACETACQEAKACAAGDCCARQACGPNASCPLGIQCAAAPVVPQAPVPTQVGCMAACPAWAGPPVPMWHAPAMPPQAHFIQHGPVPFGPVNLPPPQFPGYGPNDDPLLQALVENAELKARLDAMEKVVSEREKYQSALAEAHAENVTLKAKLEIADATQKAMGELHEMLVEKAALEAKLELAAEREGLFEEVAELLQENAAMKALHSVQVKATSTKEESCDACDARCKCDPCVKCPACKAGEAKTAKAPEKEAKANEAVGGSY